MRKLAASICALTIASSAWGADKELNIYNWDDYIYPEAVAEFEQQTGIKVNYDVYETDQTLDDVLKAGNSGYDLVVPSGLFLERQIQAGLHAPIDRSKLDNYNNLDRVLLAKVSSYDEGNTHGVPWAWGTIGLGYNVDMIRERLGDMPTNTLDLIFNPTITAKLKDCGIGVLDSPSDVIAIALNYKGIMPDSESTRHLKKVEQMLLANRDNYRYIHASQYTEDLANGDICLALGYNGDILQSQINAEEAGNGVNVAYEIPQEGTAIWFDLMAIPADAANKEAAYQFIDFILQPETAARISNHVYYAVPNRAAAPFLDKDVSSNEGVYPVSSLKSNLFSLRAHSDKFNRVLESTWTNIKSGI
jgi:putrescine transport system substrate-binding protein